MPVFIALKLSIPSGNICKNPAPRNTPPAKALPSVNLFFPSPEKEGRVGNIPPKTPAKAMINMVITLNVNILFYLELVQDNYIY